jgi:hypothetical protein
MMLMPSSFQSPRLLKARRKHPVSVILGLTSKANTRIVTLSTHWQSNESKRPAAFKPHSTQGSRRRPLAVLTPRLMPLILLAALS